MISGATVFDFLDNETALATTPHGGIQSIRFQKLILATGARELFFPFPGWTLPGVFKTAMSVLGASRLLFGTDYLARGQAVPQFSLYKNLELPAEVQGKVFSGNARRLLGLSA